MSRIGKTGLFIVVTFIVASVVIGALHIFQLRSTGGSPLVQDKSSICNNGNASDVTLSKSSEVHLRKLAEYEAVCHGAVTSTLMTFVGMPTTENEAQQASQETASTLHEFASHHLSPLISFEPPTSSKTIISDIKNGTYDVFIKDFYTGLKSAGVTDAEMGTWILLPEANTPAWYNTNPSDFTTNVVKIAGIQKQVFPNSKITLLLNSRTYSSDDTNWDHGELTSLLPYVQNIPTGIVDSFGYQGFPSVSAANVSPGDAYSQLTAGDFMPSNLAIEAAQSLHVSDIWLNTGTFSRMYTDDTTKEVQISTKQRGSVLDSILDEALKIKALHMNVFVNMFNADKSNLSEHVDWSYWSQGKAGSSADTQLFVSFASRLRMDGIGLSIYDN